MPPDMKILAIESSTEAASVALLCGDVLLERDVPGRTHSETLLPAIRALLGEAGCPLNALDGVAFGAGPGAFTGLRLACGAAQGLAMGIDRPVVPVGTLEALASLYEGDRIFVAMDARMAEVYFAAYRRVGTRLDEVLAPACARPEDVRLPASGSWAGVGSAFAAYPDRLLPGLGDRLLAVDAALQPRAGAVARLAAVRLARGEGLDATLAAPLYVRDKVALTTAERLAQGGRA